jgi:putative membrane protein
MAKNTIFSGRLSRMKIKATIIVDVWPELLFFTFVSMGECVFGSSLPSRSSELRDRATPVVVLIDKFSNTKLGLNNQLLTVLGVALGLVVSFRTTTAYER